MQRSSQEITLKAKQLKSKKLAQMLFALTDDVDSIKSLDVSQNKITETEFLALFTSLSSLTLSHNSVRRLVGLPNTLVTLNISYNGLQSLDGIETLKGLLDLNISYNMLSALDGLNACTRLKSLQASGNRITKIQGFDRCKNLISLDLQDNLIKRIDCLRPISFNSNLQHLQLDGNPVVERNDFRIQVFNFLPGLRRLNDEESFMSRRQSARHASPIHNLEHRSDGLSDASSTSRPVSRTKAARSPNEFGYYATTQSASAKRSGHASHPSRYRHTPSPMRQQQGNARSSTQSRRPRPRSMVHSSEFGDEFGSEVSRSGYSRSFGQHEGPHEHEDGSLQEHPLDDLLHSFDVGVKSQQQQRRPSRQQPVIHYSPNHSGPGPRAGLSEFEQWRKQVFQEGFHAGIDSAQSEQLQHAEELEQLQRIGQDRAHFELSLLQLWTNISATLTRTVDQTQFVQQVLSMCEVTLSNLSTAVDSSWFDAYGHGRISNGIDLGQSTPLHIAIFVTDSQSQGIGYPARKPGRQTFLRRVDATAHGARHEELIDATRGLVGRAYTSRTVFSTRDAVSVQDYDPGVDCLSHQGDRRHGSVALPCVCLPLLDPTGSPAGPALGVIQVFAEVPAQQSVAFTPIDIKLLSTLAVHIGCGLAMCSKMYDMINETNEALESLRNLGQLRSQAPGTREFDVIMAENAQLRESNAKFRSESVQAQAAINAKARADEEKEALLDALMQIEADYEELGRKYQRLVDSNNESRKEQALALVQNVHEKQALKAKATVLSQWSRATQTATPTPNQSGTSPVRRSRTTPSRLHAARKPTVVMLDNFRNAADLSESDASPMLWVPAPSPETGTFRGRTQSVDVDAGSSFIQPLRVERSQSTRSASTQDAAELRDDIPDRSVTPKVATSLYGFPSSHVAKDIGPAGQRSSCPPNTPLGANGVPPQSWTRLPHQIPESRFKQSLQQQSFTADDGAPGTPQMPTPANTPLNAAQPSPSLPFGFRSKAGSSHTIPPTVNEGQDSLEDVDGILNEDGNDEFLWEATVDTDAPVTAEHFQQVFLDFCMDTDVDYLSAADDNAESPQDRLPVTKLPVALRMVYSRLVDAHTAKFLTNQQILDRARVSEYLRQQQASGDQDGDATVSSDTFVKMCYALSADS